MELAAHEWAMADLGERCRNLRLIKVAQQMGDKPTHSIPGARGGWMATAGAYRLISNDSFDPSFLS